MSRFLNVFSIFLSFLSPSRLFLLKLMQATYSELDHMQHFSGTCAKKKNPTGGLLIISFFALLTPPSPLVIHSQKSVSMPFTCAPKDFALCVWGVFFLVR